MAEVRWAVSAANDLRAIEDWIARDSPHHAVQFVDRLIHATDRLKKAPRAGRIVPECGRNEIREVIFRGYRIVYLTRPRIVTILRVLHAARDLDAIGESEGWILP